MIELSKCSIYYDIFKNIIKVPVACFQATDGEKMTHFVWIIMRKSIKMWIEENLNDRILKQNMRR